MKIFFFHLITLFSPVTIHCEITGITQYGRICEGGRNIWTVGYGNRSLQATVHCNNCFSVLKDRVFFWCLSDSEGCKSNSLLGKKSSTQLIDQNVTHLIYELTLYDAVARPQKELLYGFRTVEDNTFRPDKNNTIYIEYCSRMGRINITVNDSTGTVDSTYGHKGNFNCPNKERLVNTAEKKLATDSNTTCGTCAKWQGMDEMDCWRAPYVSLKSTNSNRSYSAGHILNATEICNVTDWGKPTANLSLSWNASNEVKEVMSTVTLRAEDHSKTIYCVISNDLTDLMETGPVSSQPLLLSIEFKPSDLSNRTSSCHSDDESILFNLTLEVNFSANPIGRAEFLDKYKNKINSTLTNGSHGCCGVFLQQYEIVLTDISADFSITFDYYQNNNKTSIGRFEDLTKSCKPTQRTMSGYMSAIVGISAGCGVLLVILIIVMVFLMRRRRQKGDAHVSGPEERENVLYGTTQLNSSGKNKEVVENVLYGTKGATDGPTDEYAEVVPKAKRKQGKSNFKDNGTTAASAEATYAVVDKKTAGKSGSDNAGFSGDPQPEATYAVVNKKGKKI